jgi:cytochrome b6-f complex iron-sulfur subunit
MPAILPLDSAAQRSLRHGGLLSRRQLLRRTLGAGIGLWLIEITSGTVAFLWPTVQGGFGSTVKAGELADLETRIAVPGTALRDGAPAYIRQAKAYVQLIDPTLGMRDGDSPEGDGLANNVRALWQRCPHLGCKPNFCTTSYRFECPCHMSRYDRLGTKIALLGPAQRSMDRFATSVKDGVLTIDTSIITLGPLPLEMGAPGLLPPRGPTGCV